MVSDSMHRYTYDAEGKVVQVDGGSTAQYAYDAMDHRVRITMQGKDNEFLFDPFGRRQSTWLVAQNFGSEGKIYWDQGLLANRGFNGQTTYHHTNYLGTERTRTNYQGLTSATETSGPFGENLNEQNNANLGNASEDNGQYTGQEHDPESNTEHFQYRQYTSRLGHWLSPDPSSGSLHFGNPQSFNRYAYVLNNPLFYTDPDGTTEDNPWSSWSTFANTTSMTDAFRASLSAAEGGQPIDAGAWVDSSAHNPFVYQVSGTLFGKPVSQTFDTFNQYADWRTSQSALPENEAYAAYTLACQHTTTPCTGANLVTTAIRGITSNYSVVGQSVDPNSMSGLIQDPPYFSKIFHDGKDSWYQWQPLDTGHIASLGSNIEVHFDSFGLTALPLHLLFNVLPGQFINTGKGMRGPSYTCSQIGGCQ